MASIGPPYPPLARWADKPAGPSQFGEILSAGILCCEAPFQLYQRFGKVFVYAGILHVGPVVAKCIAPFHEFETMEQQAKKTWS